MANEPVPEHSLRLDDRARLCVTGVRDVESFDEESVVLHTPHGVLVIRGEALHLQTLSLDGGKVLVNGAVQSLSYEETQKSGGFFARLLR